MRPYILPVLLFPLAAFAIALPDGALSVRQSFKTCGTPKSCELNNCAGVYYEAYHTAACTAAFVNCVCIRGNQTPDVAGATLRDSPVPADDDDEEKKKKKKKKGKEGGRTGGGGPPRDPGCPPKTSECREDP